MKELTIEQKAQRYDEAIEIAKRINNEQQAQPFNIMTRVFPELAESEDERIVKFIKNQLFNIKKTITENYELDAKLTNAIAWLEKQGEQNLAFIEKGKWYVCIRTSYKPNGKDFIEGKTYYAKEDYKIIGECGEVDIATDNPEEFFRSATEEETNDIIKNFVNEQKPAWSAWSEEDDNCLSTIIAEFSKCAGKSVSKDEWMRCNDWLNSLRDRVQPKQEWSEEDEERLSDAIRACEQMSDEYYYYSQSYINAIKWLKSLKDRSTWRPSDEQIIELRRVISGCSYDIEPLAEMEEQLKKLREE